VPNHFTRPRRSITRFTTLNTRRASGLRARYAPRAIIVLDRWGASQASAAPCPDCAFRASMPVAADPHPSSLVRVRALPTYRDIDKGSTATRALKPTSFPARPAVTVGRRWRRGQRCVLGGFGLRAGMSFGLGCQFAREDFRPPFERTADVCLSG